MTFPVNYNASTLINQCTTEEPSHFNRCIINKVIWKQVIRHCRMRRLVVLLQYSRLLSCASMLSTVIDHITVNLSAVHCVTKTDEKTAGRCLLSTGCESLRVSTEHFKIHSQRLRPAISSAQSASLTGDLFWLLPLLSAFLSLQQVSCRTANLVTVPQVFGPSYRCRNGWSTVNDYQL